MAGATPSDFFVLFMEDQPTLQAHVGTSGKTTSIYDGMYKLTYTMSRPDVLEVRVPMLASRHGYAAIKEFLMAQKLNTSGFFIQKVIEVGSVGGPIH